MMEALTILLMSTGLLILGISGVGAIRLPDFYTRSHALGVLDTLGMLLILGGLMLHYGFSFESGKMFILLLFIYTANPTITHVLVRAALRCGLKPYDRRG